MYAPYKTFRKLGMLQKESKKKMTEIPGRHIRRDL